MDSSQLQWPDDFPEQCPPPNATPCSGTYYRFVSNPIDVEKDFVSEFSRSKRLRERLIEQDD